MIVKEYTPGLIYKLHQGDHPAGMMGLVLQQADPKPDLGKMMVRYTISTEALDRSREIVRANGLIVDEHRANPIVLLNHNRSLPVGLTRDQSGGYTVTKSSPNRWQADFYFDQKTLLGQQAFEAVERGSLGGASIGFLPIPNQIIRTKGHDGYPVTDYRQVKLVEISAVPIPDNQECLREMICKGLGGKPLCDPLLQSLTPYVTEKPVAVVGGWETKAAKEHPYHCLMIPLKDRAAKAVLDAGNAIADDDLAGDGRDTEPHITVKYGFDPEKVKPEDIQRLVSLYGPFSVVVGEVDCFSKSDGDVLHFAISEHKDGVLGVGLPLVALAPKDKDKLRLLNESLCELPNKDKYPDYKPHATIAYLKKGKGEKYKKLLAGDPGIGSVLVTELLLCTADGERIVIPLAGSKDAKNIQSKTNRKGGWRVKAMQGYNDQQNATADDPMLASDETAEPEMKVGASFAHGLYQQMMQMVDFIDAGLEHQEDKNIIRLAKRMKSIFGKAATKMQDAYAKYRTDHPDMPELPQLDMGMESSNEEDDDIFDDDDTDTEGDEGTTTPVDSDDSTGDEAIPDESDDADSPEPKADGDGDADDVSVDGSDDEDEDDDDSKWDKKQLAYWYRKADAQVKGWWKAKTIRIAESEIKPVQEAKDFCAKIAGNKNAAEKVRNAAAWHAKNLDAALLKTKAPASPSVVVGLDWVSESDATGIITKANTETPVDDSLNDDSMQLLLSKLTTLSQVVQDQGTIIAEITGR